MYYWLRAVHHHNDMREMDFFREKSLALKSQAFDTPLFYTCRLYKKDRIQRYQIEFCAFRVFLLNGYFTHILAVNGAKRSSYLLLSALAYQAEVGFFEHGALARKRTSTLVTILV